MSVAVLAFVGFDQSSVASVIAAGGSLGALVSAAAAWRKSVGNSVRVQEVKVLVNGQLSAVKNELAHLKEVNLTRMESELAAVKTELIRISVKSPPGVGHRRADDPPDFPGEPGGPPVVLLPDPPK